MKKMSKTTVYSEAECPHCGGFINYDQIYARFHSVLEQSFEYQCLNCRGIIRVETENIPVFKLGKAAEQNVQRMTK